MPSATPQSENILQVTDAMDYPNLRQAILIADKREEDVEVDSREAFHLDCSVGKASGFLVKFARGICEGKPESSEIVIADLINTLNVLVRVAAKLPFEYYKGLNSDSLVRKLADDHSKLARYLYEAQTPVRLEDPDYISLQAIEFLIGDLTKGASIKHSTPGQSVFPKDHPLRIIPEDEVAIY